jgi:hypothetical protein
MMDCLGSYEMYQEYVLMMRQHVILAGRLIGGILSAAK